MTTIEKLNKYVAPTYATRIPVVVESGKDSTFTDENGKTFIDFTSGIGVNSIGVSNEKWVNAVTEQAKKVSHVGNYYYTKPYAEAAEKICTATNYSKVFFSNSGAEANECALKIARKYSFDKYSNGNSNYSRNKILSLKNSFHGRTIATITATGQDVFHNYFFPFPNGFEYADIDSCIDKIKKDNDICGVIFEYVQGEGGVNNMPDDFIDELFKICAGKDVITIADEVQTGIGRTGKFLCGEFYNKQADVTTLAKGLGNGLPIGATLMSEKVDHILTASTHGSTFGGNCVVMAGACVVIDEVNNSEFLNSVKEKSEYIREKLNATNLFGEISGTGLMIGIELKSGNANDMKNKAAENGLLVLTAKEKVRFLPPLSITYEEIDKGLEIFLELVKNG